MICDGDCLNCKIDCPYPDIPDELSEAPLTEKERKIADQIEIDSILHCVETHERKLRMIRDRKKPKVRKCESLRQKGVRKHGIELLNAQEKIMQSRVARGMTSAKLAELAGVTRETISYWESGYYKADWDKITPVFPELEEVARKEQARLKYKGRKKKSKKSSEDTEQWREKVKELRTMRHRAGLSAQQVADSIGVKSKANVLYWETGKKNCPQNRYKQMVELYESMAQN